MVYSTSSVWGDKRLVRVDVLPRILANLGKYPVTLWLIGLDTQGVEEVDDPLEGVHDSNK